MLGGGVMDREIIVNSSEEEIRIAVLEKEKPVEFFVERREEKKIVGNIYKGIIKNILPGIQSVFVDIGLGRNAYLDFSNIKEIARKELVLEKEILVQITKEAIGTKGVKVTNIISLPGRCLVYMPDSKKIGVSQLITDKKERIRLRGIMEKLLSANDGCILRTEAEGSSINDLKRESRFLINLWKSIITRYGVFSAPALIHKDLGIIFKIVRDMLSLNVDLFLIDSRKEYDDVLEFVGLVLPHLKKKISFYQNKIPLFEKYNLEKEIKKLIKARVNLPSGGYIIIQETEALCAIDINSGRFVGSKNSEETALAVNLEAAVAVARQVRLRNIGGIIIVDFVSMRYRKNNEKIISALGKNMKADKAKIKIVPVSSLGLIAMTRERKRESIMNVLCDTCSCCGGTGMVISVKTISMEIRKEIIKMAKTPGIIGVMVSLSSPVANYFSGEKIKKLEEKTGRKIKIKSDFKMHIEDYRISPWI